jgi:type II secretory pathway pseudopilin PulG
MLKQPRRKPFSGFTLSEIMIGLGILGLISIFALPKVIGSFNGAADNSRWKEVITTLQTTINEGIMMGELSSTNLWTYLQRKLQSSHTCANGVLNGCINATDFNHASWSLNTFGTLVLNNGAVIAGLTDGAALSGGYGSYSKLAVDINGNTAPNQLGDDQIVLLWYWSFNNPSSVPANIQPGLLLRDSNITQTATLGTSLNLRS